MLKSCEAFFVYTHLNMANLIPFTKRFESSENLVDLLESRGLQICDRNKAIQYLDNIGYYRLSAYMYPLLKMPKTAHLYKEGSTFKKVMMLYRFDKKLRLLMFNEIEKIEIAIRRAVMQITADMTGNPFWLTDSSYFLDSSKFNETMRAISKEYSKSKEEFILHFKRTYSEPYPPSWILGELLTIGNVNAIYRNIKQNRIRKRIAKRFGLPINVFESWLTVIAVTRNACGHHSRVWNKQNAIQPAIPNSPVGEWITQPTDSMRAYFQYCSSLTEISIPKAVTSIGVCAFYDCSALEEVVLSGTNDQFGFFLPTVGDGAFAGTSATLLFLTDVTEEMFKAEGNAATCQSWGSVTWKAIHYNLTADNPASLTDTANYSGHWLKDSPQ